MSSPSFASTKRIAADSKIAVHHPHGQLNGHPECFDWLEEVRRDIKAGHSSVVIDLAEIDRIDSTGLGILASAHVSAANAGGKLCLAGLDRKLHLLFETTWLFKVIQTAGDVEEAIQALAPPA